MSSSKRLPSSRIGGSSRKEAGHVLWEKLYAHGCPKFLKAQRAQVLVEVTKPGRQWQRLDAGFSCARSKSSPRPSRPSSRSPDGGGTGPAPAAKRRAGAPAEDGGPCGFLVSRGMPASAGRGRKRKARRCGTGPLAVRSPSRRPRVRPLPTGKDHRHPDATTDVDAHRLIPSRPSPAP